jgi:hypothetical protein
MPVHDWTRVNAGTFHHFHTCWVAELAKALNDGLLPADYYALAEQVAGGVVPDVLTLQAAVSGDDGPEPAGGLAVAVQPPKARFSATFEADLYAERSRGVVIRHASGDRVVAMIEIVSPGNKATRHALRSFIDKAYAALKAGCHLLVVDLFPPGPRDPQGIHGALAEEFGEGGFKLPDDKPLALAAYSAGELKRYYVEPLAVGDALEDMPLFLTADVYVPAPLEATYLAAWSAVPRRWRVEVEGPTS